MQEVSEKKSNKQYEKMMFTPVPKLIISLSIPTIISMMVTNLYNLVDTAFVGTINTSASGAVGIVFGFMAILQAIGFTFGQGSGSIISRMLGAKDSENASKVASTSLCCSFIVAVVVCIICALNLDGLITLLGSTSTIAPYAKTYISFILAVGPLCCISFTINNILRYEGRAFYGMIGLGTGAILNIGGDALFLMGMDMGIAGAGLSTAISQVVSCFILFLPFIRRQTQCRLSFKNVRFDFRMIGNVVLTGLPSLLRQGLNSIATILLNSVAGMYGDAAVAGMSIVSRLFFFLFSVAIGVGQGYQPVSGFSYGAKKYKRLREAFRFTFLLAEVLMVVLGTVLFILAPKAVWWMRQDPDVLEVAVRALRLQCLAVITMPICMATEMTMQSTGQKWRASFLSCMRNGFLFIPLLLILSNLRGIAGIQEAQPIAYVLNVPIAIVVAVLFFKKLPKDDVQE